MGVLIESIFHYLSIYRDPLPILRFIQSRHNFPSFARPSSPLLKARVESRSDTSFAKRFAIDRTTPSAAFFNASIMRLALGQEIYRFRHERKRRSFENVLPLNSSLHIDKAKSTCSSSTCVPEVLHVI